MKYFERSIKIALDKLSGEILEADEVFDDKKDAFAIRKKFHRNEIDPYCCECEQKLNISTSKYDRVHFKHQPQHKSCILTDGELTPKQLDEFIQILLLKESPRHKELKNKIAEKISKIEGIDIATICIDNRFIIRGDEKRRPDVYCKYYDKELVFEIQLSDLSLRYILSRYDFYRKNGIYLIWILDNYDVHKQAQLERDIKYLTKYENFFKLDEKSDDFKLECKFKYPFLTESNKLLTKWMDKSVSLDQIKFDKEFYQIYYFNFGDNKNKVEVEQQRISEEINESLRNKIKDERLALAEKKSKKIVQEIKNTRVRKSGTFGPVKRFIDDLDEFELEILHTHLNFKNKFKNTKPALNYWIHTATKEDAHFIDFILSCEAFEFDVNEKDSEGISAFYEVYQNKNLDKYFLVKCLFKRGYLLTNEDIKYFESLIDSNKNLNNILLVLKFCNNLIDRNLVDVVFNHDTLLFIIESAKRNVITGFNYKANEWIAFANNSIQHYGEYWDYIELAYKKYGLWDKLIQIDKKETFRRKVLEFYSEAHEKKYDVDDVFKDLYPELVFDNELENRS